MNRKAKKRRIARGIYILAGAALALAIAAAAFALWPNSSQQTEQTPAQQPEQTPAQTGADLASGAATSLTVAVSELPHSIDPLAAAGTARDIVKQLYVSVLRHDPGGDYASYGGDIAVDADGLGYTVTCHKGMTYTDGTPVTVRDVEYYLRATGMEAAFAVQDDYTLRVRLAAPDAGAYARLAEALFVPREAQGVLVGSGPYMWAGADENSITLSANAGFLYGPPKTDAVIWRADADPLALLLAGGADIADVPASEDAFSDLAQAGLNYDAAPQGGGMQLLLNAALNENVQNAIACVLDRESAVNAYYHGAARTAEYTGPLPGYAPGDAEGYLMLAGYAREGTEDDAPLLLDGEALSLEAYFTADGTGNSPAYAMLINARNRLVQLGCELTLHDVDAAALIAAVADGSADIACTDAATEPAEGYAVLPFYARLRLTAYYDRLDIATVQQADGWCDYTDMLYCICTTGGGNGYE